jgi:hypothetical protein
LLTADPSLRLMFVTQEYNHSMSYLRPTVPPVAFAGPDGAPIPAPAWADGLAQAAGDFLAWSGDGRYLAFDGYTVDEEGRVEIPRGQTASRILLLIAEPATGDLFTPLPEGFHFSPLAGGPTWSPDGAQLAIPLSTLSTKWKEAIHIVRPGAAPPQQITPPGALFSSWSPVDNRLAYLEYAPADATCPPFYPGDRSLCDQVTLKLVDIDSGAISTLLRAFTLPSKQGAIKTSTTRLFGPPMPSGWLCSMGATTRT